MLKLEIFDSAMCCSTGICGSSTDPTLVTFASDLEWLRAQGVEVIRHGLSFEPDEFVNNEIVKEAVCAGGNACLPLMLVDSKIVSKSVYPSRKKLAEFCRVAYNEDEAPPIHREENCCCGVDCDCAHPKVNVIPCGAPECDCSNAPAEENCSCGVRCDCTTSSEAPDIKVVLFILITLALLAVVFVKILF